jgi:hypothetical protein
VEALSDLLLVAGTEAEHTAASVQLVAHVLVHLAEFVELSGDIVILKLDNLGVLLESVLLSKVVNVLTAEGVVSHLGLVEILSLEEELIVAVLKTSLEFTDLS